MRLVIEGKDKEIAKIALDFFDDLVERKGIRCVAFVGSGSEIRITILEEDDETQPL